MVLLVVTLIFLVMMYYGYKRGLIRIALSLASYVAAILIAVALAGPVSKVLTDKTPLYDTIEENISLYMKEYIGDQVDIKIGKVDEDELKKVLKDVPLPESVTKSLVKNVDKKEIKDLGAKNIGEYVSKELTKTIINAISYVIVFIVASIILNIVIVAFDVFAKLPVINEANKLAGDAIGFVLGLVVVWLLGLAVTALAGTEPGQQVMRQISDSSVLSWIYENNPLMKIFF